MKRVIKSTLFLAGLLLAATHPLPAATNDLTAALQKGLFEEEANHDLPAAIEAYQAIAARFDQDRRLAATAVFRLGECYRKQGVTNNAAAQYQRVLRDFADEQTLVTLSRQNLAGLGLTPAGPSSAVADAARQEQKRLLAEEIKLAENKLASVLKEKAGGYISQDGVDAAQRDVLELKRQLVALDAAPQGGSLDPSNPAAEIGAGVTSTEAEEVARIRELIKNSPDLINASHHGGDTPLQSAAAKGQLVVARYLLDNGADVNLQAPNNPTPLYKAAAAGHRAMVELLLTHGANADAVNGAGQTPLHIAGQTGFKAVVEVLLAHNAKVDAADSNGDTPLHDAAGGGMKGFAQVLLDHRADPNSRDRYGRTPLHYAARNGHEDLVELLLAHQADINAKDWGIADAGAFQKEGNRNGATPLVLAIIQKQTDTVKLLLAHKADIAIECEASFEELESGHQIPFPQRRGNALASLEEPQPGRQNPFLRRRGNALYMAVGRGDPSLVDLLLQAGANPNSPAAICKKDGFVPCTSLLLAVWDRPDEIVKSLLAAKADANVPDETGATPLYNAVAGRESTNLVTLLLDHGAEINTRNHEGKTPLWVACQLGRVSMASLLLDHRADPNLAPPDGTTPLHWASRYRDKDLVQLLLDKGANPNLRNQQGSTPLDEVKWNYSLPGPQSQRAEANELSDLLRLHGAVTDFPRLDRIELHRPASGFSQVIFSKGTNENNQFTLMELIAVHYGFVAVSPPQPSVFGGRVTDHEYKASGFVRTGSLGFPNLEKILIRRPTSDGLGRTTIPVDLSALFHSGDCSRDPALQWGDIVELSEIDHPISAAWQGFSEEDRAALGKCLNRHVQLTIKGGTTNLALTLWTHAPDQVSYSHTGFVDLGYGLPAFSLLPFLQSSGLLRASSDLSRVKVRRLDPATGQNREWLFDCATPNAVPTFWLRDGDAVEVPEKP